MTTLLNNNEDLFTVSDKAITSIISGMLSNAHMLQSFETKKLNMANKYRITTVVEGCTKNLEISKQMIERCTDMYNKCHNKVMIK